LEAQNLSTKSSGLAHQEEFLEECISIVFLGGNIFGMSIEPLLRLPEQGEREKVKTDSV